MSQAMHTGNALVGSAIELLGRPMASCRPNHLILTQTGNSTQSDVEANIT